MACVLTFPGSKPKQVTQPERPIAPTGGTVYVCNAQNGGFLVYDESPSGGSAGLHGEFEDYGAAAAEGRAIAAKINGTFRDISSGGSAA